MQSNRGEQVYRYVRYDARDTSQVQFYVREINNAQYINFTFINQADREWFNLVEPDDVIGFYQDDDVRATAKVLTAYDTENGYRIEAVPDPALNEGQIYEIAFTTAPPPDRTPVPVENRGWSPLFAIQYVTFDGTTYSTSNTRQPLFAFRVADWTSGQGVKPQLGYLGINGLVGDVNDAAILQLPAGVPGASGTRGTRWTQETTLPTSGQVSGDMNLFPSAVASGLVNYFQADGTTAKADAEAGEVARWDGTKWRFVMVLSISGISDDVFVDMHDGLRDATADDYGKVGIGPDGKLYRVKRTAAPGHDAAGTFNAYTHAQYRGVAHNRPSNPQDGEIYYNIRIHQWYLFFINRVVSTIDAQPITPVQALGANTVWLGEVDDVYQARHAIQNFDNTKAYYAVWNETLYVLDNSTYTAATTGVTYTYKWIESFPDNIVTMEELQAILTDKLLPTYPSAGSRNEKVAKFEGDTLTWKNDGQGLTPQQKAQFDSLVAKTADLLVQTSETWVAATDASFLALPADNAQLARVRSGNAPQGLSGWTTDVTTTEPRVILIRVPLAAQLADYRILLGNDNAVRLDSYGVDATGSNYAYMTSTSLVLQEASRIRLQHHGAATHTRFIGMLADALMARLLPDLPAEGQRDNKVPQFDGNSLVWEILSGSGLTSAQLARLLPTLPAEGDRNDKIAQFVNDVLTWKAIEGFVTEYDFEHRRNHTPNRVTHLPVRLDPQEQSVLVSDGHWSDEYYQFVLAEHNVTIGGATQNYIGVNTLAFSTELPVFGNTGLPSIFRANRIAAIYARFLDGSSRFNIKIIIDKALIPTKPDPSNPGNMILDFGGLRLGYKSPAIGNRSSPLTQTTFFSDEPGQTLSENEMTVGGRTYVALTPTLDGASETETRVYNYSIDMNNVFNNRPRGEALIEFHISYTNPDGTAVTYLSDDLNTPWASADEYPAGLYEGDVNGHPIAAALPSRVLWDHVVARSNTYFSGTSPQAAAGVDGQFWANLRNGQIHQKQSGTWTLITDLALQTEISRATEWSTIPNNRQIPADFITRFSGRYFGAKLQHVKTSGSSDPTGDTTNWIELSNETSVVGADGKVIFTTDRPANDVGKVGDVAIRRLSSGIGFYEKTGDTTWTYRYELLTLPSRPPQNARDRLGLFWDGNTLGWSEQKAVFAELGISASIVVPQETETAIPITYAASLVTEKNSSDIIGRATAGNAITLKAGTYVIDIDMNVSTETSGENARTNIEFTVYNGATLLKTKRGGYLRSLNAFDEQVASARFTIDFASDATIQIRVKMHDNDLGDPTITTQAGGLVTVRRVGI